MLLALPTATWFLNASLVPLHVLRLSVSPPTCACPAALAVYTAMPCACPRLTRSHPELCILPLQLLLLGAALKRALLFACRRPKCALPARPAAPSPHHPPRAAVCRAGVFAPVPTQPTPRSLAPVLTLAPPSSPLLLEQEATMKSALFVSSLLMGAQAFTPTLPLNNAFVQRQAARAEPARAARGRGGESVYGCGCAGAV